MGIASVRSTVVSMSLRGIRTGPTSDSAAMLASCVHREADRQDEWSTRLSRRSACTHVGAAIRRHPFACLPRVLFEVMRARVGGAPPSAFVQRVASRLPTKWHGRGGRRLRAAECRPLALRNTDSTVITSAVGHAVSPAAAAAAHPAQHGCLRWRQLAYNTTEIDGFARVAAFRAGPARYDEPLLVTCDFVAAFPGVAHGAMSA